MGADNPATATLLSLVDVLYAVCDDLGRWPVFLRRLARGTGSALAFVHEIDRSAGRDVGLVAYPLDGELLKRYDRHSAQAPWFDDRVAARLEPGQVFEGHEALPAEAFEQTDFFRQFMKPAGLGACLTVTFDQADERLRALSLLRTAQTGPFAPADRELVAALAPHLRRALRLSDLLAGAERLRLALQDTVERVPMGMLLFDADGQLVLANARARKLLGQAQGLSLDLDGRPVGPNPEVTAELRRLLGRAAVRRSPGMAPTAGQLLLPRGSQRRPLSALVAPVPSRQPDDLARFSALFLADPEDRLTPRAEVLQERCGLTPAEARVACMIVQGHSVEEVAAELDSSLHTVRTHLKRIYAKTGTHRQASLVALLVNVVGALDTEVH